VPLRGIQLEDEPIPAGGRPLLQPAIRDGVVVPGALPPLAEIKERAAAALAALPEEYKALEHPPTYPVVRSERLQAMREEAIEAFSDGDARR
jgi:hypothetical protein